MRALDLTEQRFGKLTACHRVPRPPTDKKRNAWWECICECGERVTVRAAHLRALDVRSCGCIRRTDLWGQRFGRLVVEDLTPEKTVRGVREWVCRCDCGNVVTREGWQLMGKDSTSCGCAMRDHQSRFGELRRQGLRP